MSVVLLVSGAALIVGIAFIIGVILLVKYYRTRDLPWLIGGLVLAVLLPALLACVAFALVGARMLNTYHPPLL